MKYGPMTPEHRAKLSAAMKGRTRSAEHAAKISAALRGRQSPKKGRPVSAAARINMRTRQRDHMIIPTDATLRAWISRDGMSLTAIAHRMNCGRDTLARYLRERGIDYDRRAMGPLKPRRANHRTVAFRILGLPKVCQHCGRSEGKILVHHVDHDTTNNLPSNLRVLCNSCHMKQHPDNQGRFK